MTIALERLRKYTIEAARIISRMKACATQIVSITKQLRWYHDNIDNKGEAWRP